MHPDKNKGNELAKVRFQNMHVSYEALKKHLEEENPRRSEAEQNTNEASIAVSAEETKNDSEDTPAPDTEIIPASQPVEATVAEAVEDKKEASETAQHTHAADAACNDGSELAVDSN